MSETHKPNTGACYFNKPERCYAFFDGNGIEQNHQPCMLETIIIPDNSTVSDVFVLLRLMQGLVTASNTCKKTNRALIPKGAAENINNQENI